MSYEKRGPLVLKNQIIKSNQVLLWVTNPFLLVLFFIIFLNVSNSAGKENEKGTKKGILQIYNCKMDIFHFYPDYPRLS